jgi:hypothetical protein
MKRIFALIILAGLLALVSLAYAQDNEENLKFENHALGVHFGNVSGNGYAYRYMAKNIGFQFVAGGYTSGTNHYNLPDQVSDYEGIGDVPRVFSDNGRKYSVNLGGNVILPLKRTENTLFYIHSGVCWFYSDTKRFNREYQYYNSGLYSSDTDVFTSYKIRSYVNVGIGPGAEFLIGKYFKFVLELPITYTGNNELIMYIPQAGLYYYFK